MTIEKITFYTPYEAAKELSITPALVRRYCRQERLGKWVGNRWQITSEELKKFKVQPRKVGNPNFGPEFWKK